ncbi:hypothetical protein PO909_012884 [Leuciscus waleckii]
MERGCFPPVRTFPRAHVLRHHGGHSFQTGRLSLPRSTRPAFAGGRPRLESTRKTGRSKLPRAVFRPGRGRPQARPKFQSTRQPLSDGPGGGGAHLRAPQATRRRLFYGSPLPCPSGAFVPFSTKPRRTPFYPLTLSERSVCPLLDKTPKVRFRTVFAPTGAPSRQTDSIVPDNEALSLVASQGAACLWKSVWTASFQTLSVFFGGGLSSEAPSTPLTSPR